MSVYPSVNTSVITYYVTYLFVFQAILLQVISGRTSLARHLIGAREFYLKRRDALNSALEPISDLAPYSVPKAGLFFWIRVNGVSDVFNMVSLWFLYLTKKKSINFFSTNISKLFQVFHTALQQGLMLVPGQAFLYDSSSPSQHVRLTFSRVRFEDMDTAVRRLANLIRDEQQIKKKMYANDV